jgi:DNA-binding CsgD family transcriptional regulator
LDNDEIAGQLAISRSTVRTHLRQVFKALGIGSRGKLVPLARAWGRGDAPADDQKPAGR